jgi:phosphonate dehydrogenase
MNLSLKPRVVVTNWIHDDLLEELATFAEPVANRTRESWSHPEILARTHDAEGLMVFMPDRIDDAFLAGCPHLRVVAAALKGADNFDIAACTQRGVWFTVVPDLLTEPTAELFIGLLLGLTRNVLAGDALVRSGRFRGWRPVLYGAGLSGRRLGLIGLGAVGRAVARRLAGFQLQLCYHDLRRLEAAEERELGLTWLPLSELVSTSHFLAPLVPLNSSTQHLLDASLLARLPRGAHVINVCRGSVVDEAAVAAALLSGHLAGYAADVFEMEDWARPDRPANIHPALLACSDRTLFTPHLGSATEEARRAITRAAIDQLRIGLAGGVPPGAVNQPIHRLSVS